jgi:hypothetical protein
MSLTSCPRILWPRKLAPFNSWDCLVQLALAQKYLCDSCMFLASYSAWETFCEEFEVKTYCEGAFLHTLFRSGVNDMPPNSKLMYRSLQAFCLVHCKTDLGYIYIHHHDTQWCWWSNLMCRCLGYVSRVVFIICASECANL